MDDDDDEDRKEEPRQREWLKKNKTQAEEGGREARSERS